MLINTLAYWRLARKFSNVNWIWFYGRNKSTLCLFNKVHLTDYILEIEVQRTVHICQTLVLLLVKVLQFISGHYSISIQIHDPEPVLNALFSSLVLNSQNKPYKVTKGHFVRLSELSCTLRKYPFNSLSRQCVSWIFGQFLFFQKEIMIRIQLPEFYVDNIKVFIWKKVRISIDIRLSFNVKQWTKDFWFFELSKGHFVVAFTIGHVKHTMNDT